MSLPFEKSIASSQTGSVGSPLDAEVIFASHVPDTVSYLEMP